MQNLKQYRKRCGLTQLKLAEKLGVSRTTVTMWETQSSEPDNEMLVKIAEILQTTVDELLGVSKQAAPEKVYADYDAEMKQQARAMQFVTASSDPQITSILAKARQLNAQGLERLEQYLDDLISSGNYKKPAVKESAM